VQTPKHLILLAIECYFPVKEEMSKRCHQSAQFLSGDSGRDFAAEKLSLSLVDRLFAWQLGSASIYWAAGA
jgi:hypothetical protein